MSGGGEGGEEGGRERGRERGEGAGNAPGVAVPEAHVVANPWTALRQFTRARVALGRAGGSLPTSELLAFQLDHARAADAVHRPLDVAALTTVLSSSPVIDAATSSAPISVASRAHGRIAYLQRPDLGRQLSEDVWQDLHEYALEQPSRFDLVLVVADGLSSIAVQQHAVPFIEQLVTLLNADAKGWDIGPVVIATRGRVAIGDDIGEALKAKAVLVCIGERPGLTSPDSMGVYLTWAPTRGARDATRNCISNVRPEGLGCDDASAKAFYLLREAFRLEVTGIALKDRASDTSAERSLASSPQDCFLLADPAPPVPENSPACKTR